MSQALLLKHDLALDGIAVDPWITSFSIEITADEVEVPATAATRYKSHLNGALDATLTINYLQYESALNTNVTEILYDAILTNSGQITFSGKMTESAPWRWSGIINVNKIMVGGDVYTVGQDSQTFPINGPLTRASSAS